MKLDTDLSRRAFLNRMALGGLALATWNISGLFSSRSAAAGALSEQSGQPLWKAGSSKDKIVVVSDLHFGINDEFAETVRNRALFVDFVQRLQQTADVRELVIAGDFLDEWYLPLEYGSVDDLADFFVRVAKNNWSVIEALNRLSAAGVNVVYVIGNHDMNMADGLLRSLVPGIVEIHDAKGLGRYITGDRNEIVIEHCHRYDPYSAPDRVSNRELCNSDETMYPPGYFYARMAASWVMQNRPKIKKNYPLIRHIPDPANTDQHGAYIYAKILESLFNRITVNSDFADNVFKLNSCGLYGNYSLQDMYPLEQADGTISAPLLFRNFQRSWDERQELNDVRRKIPFAEAGAGAVSPKYFAECAKKQYWESIDASYDVVVFGHTHVPDFKQSGTKFYVNSGTWVDHNTDYPAATRTFAVVKTGAKNSAALYEYKTDGSLNDLSATVR